MPDELSGMQANPICVFEQAKYAVPSAHGEVLAAAIPENATTANAKIIIANPFCPAITIASENYR